MAKKTNFRDIVKNVIMGKGNQGLEEVEKEALDLITKINELFVDFYTLQNLSRANIEVSN